MLRLEPAEPSNYFVCKALQTLVWYYKPRKPCSTRISQPSDPAVSYLVWLLQRQGQFDKTIEALQQRAQAANILTLTRPAAATWTRPRRCVPDGCQTSGISSKRH